MVQSVRRDMHKMKALRTFEQCRMTLFNAHPESGLLHVAWVQPDRPIVQAATTFFASRRGQTSGNCTTACLGTEKLQTQPIFQ